MTPNEVMPPHRHSPNAIRFGLTGKGNFTGVDGEDITFGPGDMVLTPDDTWHNHGNVGNEPAVNLSVLDLPLVETLNAIYFEHDYTEMVDGKPVKKKQQTATVPSDYSARIYGHGGLKPRFLAAPPRRRDLLADVRLSLGDDAGAARALQGLGRRSLRGADDRICRSADRRAGVQDHDLLRADAASRARRRGRCGRPRACWSRRSRARDTRSSTASASTGRQFDTLAVPGGSWFEHVNGDPTESRRSCSSPATSRP